MSLFGITAADLLEKIIPNGKAGLSFSIGEDGDLTEAGADAIIEAQEAMVESYLRHKYQVLLRRVEGEIAVKHAYEGQATCKASLTPITSISIFKNYPRSRSWNDRKPSEAMPPEEYEVNLETGLITFLVSLRANDRIFLDYEHGGASKILDLRHLVLNLAAVEVARRFSYFRSADGFDRFEGWQTSSAGHLRDLGRTDGAQIGIFDRIDLVNETKNLNIGAL